MTSSPDSDATPAKVLEQLGEALVNKKGVDAELAKILADHILRDPQEQHCVTNACRAIVELAQSRAKTAGA